MNCTKIIECSSILKPFNITHALPHIAQVGFVFFEPVLERGFHREIGEEYRFASLQR
jgi:hypothetical protein